jgi:hypothetical protein
VPCWIVLQWTSTRLTHLIIGISWRLENEAERRLWREVIARRANLRNPGLVDLARLPAFALPALLGDFVSFETTCHGAMWCENLNSARLWLEAVNNWRSAADGWRWQIPPMPMCDIQKGHSRPFPATKIETTYRQMGIPLGADRSPHLARNKRGIH